MSAGRHEVHPGWRDERLGAITPDGMFSRKSEVDFPADLPLEPKAFLVWLTVLLWKRDAQSSSGG